MRQYKITTFDIYKGYELANIYWKAINTMDVVTAPTSIIVLEKLGRDIAFISHNQKSQLKAIEECKNFIDNIEDKDD